MQAGQRALVVCCVPALDRGSATSVCPRHPNIAPVHPPSALQPLPCIRGPGAPRAGHLQRLGRPAWTQPAAVATKPPRACADPGCAAAHGLRRCAGCPRVRYCSVACDEAHWHVHHLDCKRWQKEAAAEGSRGEAGGAAVQPWDKTQHLQNPSSSLAVAGRTPVFFLRVRLGSQSGSNFFYALPWEPVGKIWLQKHRSGAGLQSGSECCEAGGSVSAVVPAGWRRGASSARHTSVRKTGRRGRESGCEGYPQCAGRRLVGGLRKHGRVSLAESPHCALRLSQTGS